MKTYSLILNGVQSGFYKSHVPNVSAKKIFRSVCKEMIKNNLTKKDEKIDFEFDIINIDNNKKYKYHGLAYPVDEIKKFKKHGEDRFIKISYVYIINRLYFW